METDWIEEAKSVFKVEKPEHFTNHLHCEECADHDETLRSSAVDEIGLEQLGNPGWDPLCFTTAEGLMYYFPALVRLSLETMKSDFYFEQLLFHLGYAGKENRLLTVAAPHQREYVARFLAYVIASYPDELEERFSADEALQAFELWSDEQQDK